MPTNQIAKEEAKLAKRQAQVRKAIDAEKAQKCKLAKLKRDDRTHQLCVRGGKLNRLLYCEIESKVNELEAKLADQLDPFSREHLTSITSAWEERTMDM